MAHQQALSKAQFQFPIRKKLNLTQTQWWPDQPNQSLHDDPNCLHFVVAPLGPFLFIIILNEFEIGGSFVIIQKFLYLFVTPKMAISWLV